MDRTIFDNNETEIFSISAFLDHINKLLNANQKDFTIQGEIFGLQPHPSGIYLSLKDKKDGSIINCYMYPRNFYNLGLQIEDGMEIKASGTVMIYKAKGRLSFNIKNLTLAGEGSLKKAYELLKLKLDQEGLFARKRPLPEFISKIGVITSRTGAVIDDFRKNLSQLGLEILLYDARVEGAKAVPDIVDGIRWFNDHQPNLDVLVIMRGGGSLEDLQAFNNELVAKAIFASSIPTISAIGHDRDLPISSLIADATTSTPTAAAMLINNSWQKLQKNLPLLQQTMLNSFRQHLRDLEMRFEHIELFDAFKKIIENINTKIARAETILAHADPNRQLKLGYSLVTDSDNRIIKNSQNLKIDDQLNIKFYKGSIISKVYAKK